MRAAAYAIGPLAKQIGGEVKEEWLHRSEVAFRVSLMHYSHLPGRFVGDSCMRTSTAIALATELTFAALCGPPLASAVENEQNPGSQPNPPSSEKVIGLAATDTTELHIAPLNLNSPSLLKRAVDYGKSFTLSVPSGSDTLTLNFNADSMRAIQESDIWQVDVGLPSKIGTWLSGLSRDLGKNEALSVVIGVSGSRNTNFQEVVSTISEGVVGNASGAPIIAPDFLTIQGSEAVEAKLWVLPGTVTVSNPKKEAKEAGASSTPKTDAQDLRFSGISFPVGLRTALLDGDPQWGSPLVPIRATLGSVSIGAAGSPLFGDKFSELLTTDLALTPFSVDPPLLPPGRFGPLLNYSWARGQAPDGKYFTESGIAGGVRYSILNGPAPDLNVEILVGRHPQINLLYDFGAYF